MNLTLIRTTLAIAVLGLTVALIGCSRGHDAVGMPSAPAPLRRVRPRVRPVSSTTPISRSAQQMILHHEQAVAMSDTVLRKTGVRPHVTALAQQIKVTQQPEIDQLNSWLDAWGGRQVDDPDHQHGGDATIDAEKLRRG